MNTALEREKRLEAISLAEAVEVVSLADRVLETLDVSVSRGPTVGLLMVRVEEPSERLAFNFAEVTVSEAEVLAGGKRGYAMVLGRQPEKALAGAILDAAIEAGHALNDDIQKLLAASLQRDAQRQRDAWATVAPTAVQFEEMAP